MTAETALRLAHRAGSPEGMAGCVWLAQDVQTRWLWPALARRLAERHRLYPVLVVRTAEDAAYYARALGEGAAGAIAIADDYYARIAAGEQGPEDDAAIFARAAAYEKRHGISLMRAVLQGDRHLGRGFLAGAPKFATSRISANATLRRALEACLASIAFWDALAAAFPPRLVLSYAGGHALAQKPLALLCRREAVPFRTLSSSRFGQFFYWAHDEYAAAPGFAAHFRATPAPDDAAVAAVRARVAPGSLAGPEAVRALDRQHTWPGIARYAVQALARRAYGRLKGYRKATHGYHVASLVAQRVRARRHLDHLARVGVADPARLAPRRIVYLPLQVEPELTTTTWGEFASDQYALARETALSLPADAVLAIKEHPWQLGTRSRDYYARLAALPNAVLMHPKYPSLDLIRRAAAIVTINSSAGHEAAVLGVPVLHVHEASTINVLDHVRLVSGPRDLEAVRAAIAESADEAAAARRRRDGARYLLALESFCLEIAGGPITRRREAPSEDELDAYLAALAGTLPAPALGLAPARRAA